MIMAMVKMVIMVLMALRDMITWKRRLHGAGKLMRKPMSSSAEMHSTRNLPNGKLSPSFTAWNRRRCINFLTIKTRWCSNLLILAQPLLLVLLHCVCNRCQTHHRGLHNIDMSEIQRWLKDSKDSSSGSAQYWHD